MDIISTSPVADSIQAVSAASIFAAPCANANSGAPRAAPIAPPRRRRRHASLVMESPRSIAQRASLSLSPVRMRIA
jgi:hypothetical protein